MFQRKERIIEYASSVPSKMFGSIFYIWTLFIPCVIIATLINPYMWKIIIDGNMSLSIGVLITWSIGFAIIVSALATIPAHFAKFDYADVDCGYPIWQFWKWGQNDPACVERRKKFGNIVIGTGVLVIIAYIILQYKQIYGNYKLKF